MSGLSLESCVSNLKWVALTVLQLLALKAQKCRGHVTWQRSLFEKNLRVVSGLSLETRLSSLKSVALTVLELLTFNAQKFWGHVTFWKKIRVMSGLSLGTCLLNLKSVALTVLEIFAFNSHYKLVWLTGLLRTHRQKHRHRHIERTHYLRHSFRSLGGDNKWKK